MQRIVTFLSYQDQAEEAANFYVSIFKNSKIIAVMPAPKNVPVPDGKPLLVIFELDGQRFMAMNGGSDFNLTNAISLMVNCDTQEEIDHCWSRLSEGGKEVACGWLTDKFGVSWQIDPSNIGELLTQSPAAAERVMAQVMKMVKLDKAALERAAEG
jgi:predicted 3-demethylubiquinone-9 3-methyltransferase (glyoxalase superfamily)